MITTNISNTP